MRLEHFVVRRLGGPPRTVIWGWDGRRGAVFAAVMTFVVLSMGLGLRCGATRLGDAVVVGLATLGLAALAGAGIGFRVVIEAPAVRVWKVWLGVPYRRWSVPLHDAQVDVYDAWDTSPPDGVTLEASRALPLRPELRIVGTSKNADALARTLREELDRVRSVTQRG